MLLRRKVKTGNNKTKTNNRKVNTNSLIYKIKQTKGNNVYLKFEHETLNNILVFSLMYNSIKSLTNKNIYVCVSKDFVDLCSDFAFIKPRPKKNVPYILIKGNIEDYEDSIKSSYVEWNNKHLCIPKLELSSPISENLENNEYGDVIGLGVPLEDKIYEDLCNEINDCSLTYIDIFGTEQDTLDTSNTLGKLVISGSGYIPFNSELSVIGNKKITGKIIPDKSTVIEYKSKTKNITDFEGSISGSGVAKYNFNVDFNNKKEIKVNINFEEFDVTSGIDKKNMEPVSEETDVKIVIDNLFKCTYYIGPWDETFLLACNIIGPENCILIENCEGECSGKFKMDYKIIDADEYKTGILSNIFEEHYTNEENLVDEIEENFEDEFDLTEYTSDDDVEDVDPDFEFEETVEDIEFNS